MNGDGDIANLESEAGGDSDLVARQKARGLIDTWGGEKSAVSNVMQTELGLYKTILTAAAFDALKEHLFWRMCKFIDEEEAYDHVAAYHEAKDLGMDTSFNLDYLFALCSANRKIGRTDLISDILGSMSTFRFVSSQSKEKKATGDSQRGPLSG